MRLKYIERKNNILHFYKNRESRCFYISIYPCSYREKLCKIQIGYNTIIFNDRMGSPFLSIEDTLFILFLTALGSTQSFHSVFLFSSPEAVKLFGRIKTHHLKQLSHRLSVLSMKFQLYIKPELKPRQSKGIYVSTDEAFVNSIPFPLQKCKHDEANPRFNSMFNK